MPTGCNEQRLIKFIPTIAAMDYLNATIPLGREKLKEAEEKLLQGYKQILWSRISEGDKKGAFSIWGQSYSIFTSSDGSISSNSSRDVQDSSDSIWLTAYISKCLGKAKHLIQIDDLVIFDALDYLSRSQADNGSFPETGHVSYPSRQTQSSEGFPLTAFTVIAFLENRGYVARFNATIEKALNYLDENQSKIQGNYALAMVAYAMTMASVALPNRGSETAKQLLESLRDNAITEGEIMHWENSTDTSSRNESTSEAVKVEIAAYAILSHVKLDLINEALPIVRWLVSRRNSDGGFSSTQDTGGRI